MATQIDACTNTPMFLESFICPILMDYPHDPVITNCGHMFDRAALVNALALNSHCPTCRSDIYNYSAALCIKQFLEHYSLLTPFIEPFPDVDAVDAVNPEPPQAIEIVDLINAMDAVNQAENEENDALPALVDISGFYPPILAVNHLQTVNVSDLSPAARVYAGGKRIVSFDNTTTINPAGRHRIYLHDRAHDYNTNVLVRLCSRFTEQQASYFIRHGAYVHVAVSRYIIHADSLAHALTLAKARGLFIFDLFHLNARTYVLNTFDRDANGAHHDLTAYRRISHRL